MSDENESLLREAEKADVKRLKMSLWWVEHRAFLRKVGFGLFIIFDAMLLLFVLWTYLDTYAISYDKERLAVVDMVTKGQSDLRAYTIANAAEDIVEDELRIFATGNNRYDIYASLTNPNSDWWAEFKYSFIHTSGFTEPKQGFILPGQQKNIVELAQESDSNIRTAELELTDIVWHRLDHHEIKDYENWSSVRTNFEIEDPTFKKDLVDDKFVGTVVFSVINKTAYSYYEPDLFVFLKRGSTIVGVNKVKLSSLQSLQKQDIKLNWFGTIPSITNVEVVVDVHLLDPSIFKTLEGKEAIDVRTR